MGRFVARTFWGWDVLMGVQLCTKGNKRVGYCMSVNIVHRCINIRLQQSYCYANYFQQFLLQKSRILKFNIMIFFPIYRSSVREHKRWVAMSP
jgi:hypothetical protein